MTKCRDCIEMDQIEAAYNAYAPVMNPPLEAASQINDAAARENVAVPLEPPYELLVSMAIRYDNGLGCPGYYDSFPVQLGATHKQRLDSTISVMRQLYEEVVGKGFYSPERADYYRSIAERAAPEQP